MFFSKIIKTNKTSWVFTVWLWLVENTDPNHIKIIKFIPEVLYFFSLLIVLQTFPLNALPKNCIIVIVMNNNDEFTSLDGKGSMEKKFSPLKILMRFKNSDISVFCFF